MKEIMKIKEVFYLPSGRIFLADILELLQTLCVKHFSELLVAEIELFNSNQELNCAARLGPKITLIVESILTEHNHVLIEEEI